VTAAVMFFPGCIPPGLADSKVLTPARRAILHDEILASAACVSVATASAAEIDTLNIRAATHLAMRRCAAALSLRPHLILVDGNETAGLEQAVLGRAGPRIAAIIKGDARSAAIAAASIIAKVTRDRLMARLHLAHPQYGFASHQGYGTAAHLAAIHQFGPLPEHRFSFAPIKTRWQREQFPV
jgi:ribonuclease HII